MDYVNQGASALNHGIDAIVKYGMENGTIRLHDDVVWFVAKNPNFVKATSGGRILAQGTTVMQLEMPLVEKKNYSWYDCVNNKNSAMYGRRKRPNCAMKRKNGNGNERTI